MRRTRPPMAVLLLSWLVLTGLAADADDTNVGSRTGESGFIEDSCKLKYGSVGVCRSITDCVAAQEALKKGQTPIVCSYEQFTPVVCCPLAASGTATVPVQTPTSAVGAKAAKMCNEYSEAVFVLERSPVFIAPPVKRDTCVKPEVPLIAGVGGEKALPNEFPHMALLGYKSKQQPLWLCGGSLISKHYILTAAHCLQTAEGAPIVVRLGELNLKNDDERYNRHEDYGVEKPIPHPNYTVESNYNDVGLLKLDREVKFTRSIRPACLNSLTEVPNEKITATGWGRVDWADSDISDVLMKVKIPLQPTEVCHRVYRTARLRNGFDGESMICAGELAGGKDTCQGDSGGPLQTKLKSPYCMYSIIGITSFGKVCGAQNSPAVYSRVSHFLSWIESVV